MKPLKPLCIAFVFALLSAAGALAQDARRVAASSLALALEQAWRQHPPAAALEARDAEARAAQEIAAGLTPEPGSLSISQRNDRANRNLGHREYEVELATPLWLPGQRTAREAEAASRIDESVAQRAALCWELAGEVRATWWLLAAARNAQALAARRLETARALEADVRRRYRAGELSRIDANLAQSEVHIAGAELLDAGAAQLDAEQAFRTLTGAPAPLEMAEETPASADRRREALDAPEMHPQLAAAAATARSARTRVQVAEETRRAAPELALRLLRERGDFAEPYANSVGIRLKIPFSSGAQVRRAGSAAQAEADRADAEMRRTEIRVQQEVERARRAVAATERQSAMAQERRPLATDSWHLAEKSFALGETDLATLLRLRAAAIEAESVHDRQRVASAAAISRLNQALGVLP